MIADHLCLILDWDSGFFGRKIAQVAVNTLNVAQMEQIMTWCSIQKIDCLYFLSEADHAESVRLAEDNGFRLVDIRITLEKKLQDVQTVQGQDPRYAVRMCRREDAPALRAIAKTSYHDSRFYYDSKFPRHLCDSLYETWIEKSCEGYADAVLVTEFERQPKGYISCHLLGEQKGKIGLIGVAADSQGKGLGHVLIRESLRWFSQHGVEQVTVVTQGRNFTAQRLYEEFGFLTKSVQLWYHRWFDSKEYSGL